MVRNPVCVVRGLARYPAGVQSKLPPAKPPLIVARPNGPHTVQFFYQGWGPRGLSSTWRISRRQKYYGLGLEIVVVEHTSNFEPFLLGPILLSSLYLGPINKISCDL